MKIWPGEQARFDPPTTNDGRRQGESHSLKAVVAMRQRCDVHSGSKVADHIVVGDTRLACERAFEHLAGVYRLDPPRPSNAVSNARAAPAPGKQPPQGFSPKHR